MRICSEKRWRVGMDDVFLHSQNMKTKVNQSWELGAEAVQIDNIHGILDLYIWDLCENYSFHSLGKVKLLDKRCTVFSLFFCRGLFFNDNLIKIIHFFCLGLTCVQSLILICGIFKVVHFSII